MAELADALDSGSSERLVHAGSSPVSRTEQKPWNHCDFKAFLVPSAGGTAILTRAGGLCAGARWPNRVDSAAALLSM